MNTTRLFVFLVGLVLGANALNNTGAFNDRQKRIVELRCSYFILYSSQDAEDRLSGNVPTAAVSSNIGAAAGNTLEFTFTYGIALPAPPPAAVWTALPLLEHPGQLFSMHTSDIARCDPLRNRWAQFYPGEIAADFETPTRTLLGGVDPYDRIIGEATFASSETIPTYFKSQSYSKPAKTDYKVHFQNNPAKSLLKAILRPYLAGSIMAGLVDDAEFGHRTAAKYTNILPYNMIIQSRYSNFIQEAYERWIASFVSNYRPIDLKITTAVPNRPCDPLWYFGPQTDYTYEIKTPVNPANFDFIEGEAYTWTAPTKTIPAFLYPVARLEPVAWVFMHLVTTSTLTYNFGKTNYQIPFLLATYIAEPNHNPQLSTLLLPHAGAMALVERNIVKPVSLKIDTIKCSGTTATASLFTAGATVYTTWRSILPPAGTGPPVPPVVLAGGGINNVRAPGLVAGSYTVEVFSDAAKTLPNRLYSTPFTVTSPTPLVLTSQDRVCLTTDGVAAPFDGRLDAVYSGGTPKKYYTNDDIYNIDITWPGAIVKHYLEELGPGAYTWRLTDDLNCALAGANFRIDPCIPIAAVAKPTAAKCFQSTDGAIDLLTTGGTNSYNYKWKSKGVILATNTNPIYPGLAAGNYKVEISDRRQSNLAPLDKDVTVPGPSAPLTLSIVDETPTATGATFKVAVPNPPASMYKTPFVFTSTDKATTVVTTLTKAAGNPSYSTVVVPLPFGSYTLKVTDANLCSVSEEFPITAGSKLIVTPVPTNALCYGALGLGKFKVTLGGVAPPYLMRYAYLDTNGIVDATKPVVNFLRDVEQNVPKGNYQITVTDTLHTTAAGTAVVKTVFVDVPDPLVIKLIQSRWVGGKSAHRELWFNVEGGTPAPGAASYIPPDEKWGVSKTNPAEFRAPDVTFAQVGATGDVVIGGLRDANDCPVPSYTYKYREKPTMVVNEEAKSMTALVGQTVAVTFKVAGSVAEDKYLFFCRVKGENVDNSLKSVIAVKDWSPSLLPGTYLVKAFLDAALKPENGETNWAEFTVILGTELLVDNIIVTQAYQSLIALSWLGIVPNTVRVQMEEEVANKVVVNWFSPQGAPLGTGVSKTNLPASVALPYKVTITPNNARFLMRLNGKLSPVATHEFTINPNPASQYRIALGIRLTVGWVKSWKKSRAVTETSLSSDYPLRFMVRCKVPISEKQQQIFAGPQGYLDKDGNWNGDAEINVPVGTDMSTVEYSVNFILENTMVAVRNGDKENGEFVIASDFVKAVGGSIQINHNVLRVYAPLFDLMSLGSKVVSDTKALFPQVTQFQNMKLEIYYYSKAPVMTPPYSPLRIHVTGTDVDTAEKIANLYMTIAREIGHYAMYSQQKSIPVSVLNSPSAWCAASQNPQAAWWHGYATAFALILSNEKRTPYTATSVLLNSLVPAGVTNPEFEKYTCAQKILPSDQGRIAAALWDLYDDADDETTAAASTLGNSLYKDGNKLRRLSVARVLIDPFKVDDNSDPTDEQQRLRHVSDYWTVLGSLLEADSTKSTADNERWQLAKAIMMYNYLPFHVSTLIGYDGFQTDNNVDILAVKTELYGVSQAGTEFALLDHPLCQTCSDGESGDFVFVDIAAAGSYTALKFFALVSLDNPKVHMFKGDSTLDTPQAIVTKQGKLARQFKTPYTSPDAYWNVDIEYYFPYTDEAEDAYRQFSSFFTANAALKEAARILPARYTSTTQLDVFYPCKISSIQKATTGVNARLCIGVSDYDDATVVLNLLKQ